MSFPGGSDGKESAHSVGNLGSIPGSGRFPGEGNGYPLPYSCLKNLHGQSLEGYSPWGHKELDMTEQLTHTQPHFTGGRGTANSFRFPIFNILWILLATDHMFSQFSHSVVSDTLQPRESQHARPPCLSPTLGAYSNSCPSSRWCHPTVSSSVDRKSVV